MHTDPSKKARELVVALGVLARAQEFGVDDNELSELTASVREAEHAFRTAHVPAQ